MCESAYVVDIGLSRYKFRISTKVVRIHPSKLILNTFYEKFY